MTFVEDCEMSGTSIPYHLRQNKIIDRYSFIDLLLQVNKIHKISEYTYIGFGGHSLEDFKFIHNQFGVRSMISIEEDEQVFRRQKFNQPISCMKRLQKSSRDFINGFIREDKTIIWLDYTEPKKIKDQIEEFQSVLQALSPLDIIKITLNANPSALVESESSLSADSLKEKRLEKLKARLENLFPEADITSDLMTQRNYPKAICLALKFAANSALNGQPDVYFQPLAVFAYGDGQQMVTVTGILLEEAEIQNFLEKTGIAEWELSSTTWDTIKRIDIPDFTIKERLHIDSLLPDARAENIHEELGFWFDSRESKSLTMIETYILFYRRSPLFSRIIV